VVDLREDLDGYTVTFTPFVEDIDATPWSGFRMTAATARIGLRHQGHDDRTVCRP
jgi:hypothetical protein